MPLQANPNPPAEPPAEPDAQMADFPTYGDSFEPLSVDELLVRAEACALTADGQAAEYQVEQLSGDEYRMTSLHQGVVHLTGLANTYLSLALAKLQRNRESPAGENHVDPREARFGRRQ